MNKQTHQTPTPMMAQYIEIKAANPDNLLFYRMGDFYELFFEDAEIASQTLGITLTKRGKHLGNDIPMCGVPVHASDEYLQRLISHGHRVAVCEQSENPAEAKKRGAKSVVRRDVVRVVTPGTITEDNLLSSKRHNYLACLAQVKGDDELALAWIDISTGDFAVTGVTTGRLAAELARLEPSEIVLADTLSDSSDIAHMIAQSGAAITSLPASRFDSTSGGHRLRDHFKVQALDAYGHFNRAATAACGALLDYVSLTQVGRMPSIRPPRVESSDATMAIDAATRANLELTITQSGKREGSLLDIIDYTISGPGGRLLADWLASPLSDPNAINARLDMVSHFHANDNLRQPLRKNLTALPDLGRALARLSLGRGSPRDLGAIRKGLIIGGQLAALAEQDYDLAPPPEELKFLVEILRASDHGLLEELQACLDDDLPLFSRDGGFVRPGFDDGLDLNRQLRDDSRKVIARLQAKYAEASAIKNLKIKHNNMLGYFVEVAAQHGQTLLDPPHNETYIHRQTMANAMRFTTTELVDIEARIAMAAGKAIAIELELFGTLVAKVTTQADDLAARAQAMAKLDVYASLAELAQQCQYARPVVDKSLSFEITDGRHPVVEAALRKAHSHEFIANDCNLSANDEPDAGIIWLLTGPNMAGKSTFLRQNALIAILAQMGSFVPAGAAHIGIIDRLFSRVGAADDLARGRSTFMVEMVETAAILNQATARSFVILDEIGRGTATFDGLSIAWASIEHLHEVNRGRTVFATHFHELTALAETLERLSNVTMKVREHKGEVIFLHEVTAGAADHSYGVQVARLAGLPDRVVARAGDILTMLEKSEQAENRRTLIDDLPLFSAMRPATVPPTSDASASDVFLAGILPDELTPREALDALYQLKALQGKN